MIPFIIFCLLAAAGASLWFRSRLKTRTKLSGDSLYLLLYDGSAFVLHDAVRNDGCFIVAGIEYPCSGCRPVELAIAARLNVYVFAAEAIALTTHQQLMRHRAAIVKGHLFKSGGDMARLVNFIAAGAVLACAVFVYMSVGSLNESNERQQVVLEQISKWTQSPLVLSK